MSVLVLATGCRSVEQRIIYGPDRFTQAWDHPHPSELEGLDFEDAHFNSLDGTRLHGWFIQPDKRAPENVILFAHGRSCNVTTFKTQLFDFVKRHQVAILVFDYRGFGKSEGDPSETGLYNDVTAAREWLARRTGIKPSEVILMGRSLGAAVAIDVASRRGAKALIIESGFTSLSDVLRHHTRSLLKGRRLQARFDSERKIGNYAGPVFISHGKFDKVIPESHGLRLAEAATSASSVQFVEVEGGHLTPPSESYQETLDQFLRSL